MEATKTDGDFTKDDMQISRQAPTETRHASAKLFHLAKLITNNHPHANIMVKDRNIYVNCGLCSATMGAIHHHLGTYAGLCVGLKG
jgi:hypothetical protein